MLKMNVCLMSFALALGACSSQDRTHELHDTVESAAGIYGGDEVAPSDGVAMTTVGLYNSKVGYICTGSLFGQNLIITAAHCLDGDVKNLEVRFGVDMRNPAVKRPVVAGQTYSKYRKDKIQRDMGDIALLKYEGSRPEGFKSASLLGNYEILEKGTKIIAAGYGISRPTLGSGSGTLRKITLKIKDPEYSSTEMAVNQTLFNGVCSGDSGGPALIKGRDGVLYLWGATSNGAGLPVLRPCMFFAVFTRIDAYLPWILETAAKL